MKPNRVRLLVFLGVAVAAMGASRAQAQANLPPEVVNYADIVLYNGKILTSDAKFSTVSAVAIRGKTFLAVGDNNRILAMAGPKTRKVDLKGKTVTEGLMDMHGGPGGGAMARYWERKWIPGERAWKSKEEAINGIKKAVARAKPGDIVNIPRIDFQVPVNSENGGRAGFFCDTITLEEMDAITGDVPVLGPGGVNNSTMWMNSAAAKIAKQYLPKGVDTPFYKPNNVCTSSGADLDGILLPGQQAGNDVAFWADVPDNHLDDYKDEVRRFSMAGVTLGKQHMGVPLFNGLRDLWEQGELNMRFRMPFPMIPQISGHTVELPPGENAEAFFRRWANMSHIGDLMLRIVGLRIPAVGGNVQGGDAWMLEPKTRPYPDRWGNQSPFGGRIQEQQAVDRGDKNTFRSRDILIQAVRFGWDVSCDHCIGDRAFREVITAFEEGLKDQIVKRPTQRLTTNHTPMANKEDILRAAKIGVWSSISTGHSIGGYGSRDLEAGLMAFGTERVNNWSPIQSYIKAGMHPSLEGTMWETTPIEGRGIRTAFFWISKAITRKDEKYHKVWNPTEAVTRQQALWATTLWSAEQLAEDKDLGSMEPGKQADLIILDRDYMTVPEDDIEKIQVLLTMVEGRIVYEKEGAL